MQDYLIIGVHPTPNGPLHLGHISGPFLTLDIFTRCKNLLGHNTYYISGTDSFESHVLISAEKENISIKKLIDKNTSQIQQDLKSLSIDLDFFIPLHTIDYKDKYFQKCHEILNNIINEKEVIYREEFIPVDLDSNKNLIGCWLSGLCPECGSSSGSYFCEVCGLHYRPEELKKHRFNQSYNVQYQQKKALFLYGKNTEILDLIDGRYSPIKTVTNFIKKNGIYTTRLTTHGEYGEKFKDYHNNIPFTYTIGLTAFYLLCHENYLRHKTDSSANVKIVTAYGFDNISPYLTGMIPLLNLLNNPIKIDLQLINKFMYLNGQKFSTSRNHAIWVSALSKMNNFSLEVLRVFLCKDSPVEQEKNFDSALVVQDMNHFSQFWNNIFSGMISGENINLAPYTATIAQFRHYSEDAFFDHKKLVEIFLNHVYSFDKHNRSMGFILILLLFGTPFLPNMTRKILKSIFNIEHISFSTLESNNLLNMYERGVILNQFHLSLIENDTLTKLIGTRE